MMAPSETGAVKFRIDSPKRSSLTSVPCVPKLIVCNYKCVQDWCSSNNMIRLASKIKALEVENAILHNFITTELHLKHNTHLHRSRSGDLKYPEDSVAQPSRAVLEQGSDQDDFEDDISEELLAFYEQTARHKIEHRKNLAEEQRKQAEEDECRNCDELRSTSTLHLTQRSEDMKLLYGDAAAKISSMELSMQINFDSNRVKCNAPLWPNIPLRLS